MRPIDRTSYKHKQIPKRIRKMYNNANSIGYLLFVGFYATPNEWVHCTMHRITDGVFIKDGPLWEIEHYLEVCAKLKAFL